MLQLNKNLSKLNAEDCGWRSRRDMHVMRLSRQLVKRARLNA